MKVLFFAGSRIVTGTSEMELALSGPQTFHQIWDQLIARYPELATLRASARLARNGTYATPDTEFHHEDEVAIIPPVSGG